MGMQSQISEKIRAMSEPNRKIEEETKEAERKASEGYRSEPQVEQVKPKPREDRKKNAKTVSVRKGPEEIEAPTGDMKKSPEEEKKQDTSAEAMPDERKVKKNGSEKGAAGSTLNESLQNFEDLLTEAKEEKSSKKDTVYIATDQPEKELPPKQEASPREPKEIKTTVKENPRHKGHHAVHRRVIKTNEVFPEASVETEPVYCLYEPLTGSLNELVRTVTVIGKSTETHIRINNRFVSGIHARVIKEADGYYIEDVGTYGKGSTNGTKVNGVRIDPGEEGRTKLEPGDNITLANTQIIFDIKK